MPNNRPQYTGMHKHIEKEGGYAIWVPSDWLEIPMTEGHHGVIYRPEPQEVNTFFAAEKVTLPLKVSQKDLDLIRKGFAAGLATLPEVKIESQDERITKTFKTLSAQVTFVEDGVRRKRWIRTAYWGEGQLTLIAQGATEEAFSRYEGMFYNTMMTVEIG